MIASTRTTSLAGNCKATSLNTQTHILLGAWLTGKPAPRLAWTGAAGSFVPDLPMYVIVGSLRMSGISLDRIFGEYYWEEWWQIANALGHNILLWSGLSLVALWILFARARRNRNTFARSFALADGWAMMFAFALAAFIASATDLLLHHNDGHMHFWPLTEWRFSSPVSYWDPRHHGVGFGLFEAALGIALAVALFRRYANIGVRLVLVLMVIAYAAVPAFYFLSLSDHDHAASLGPQFNQLERER